MLPPAVPCVNLGNGMYQSIASHDNGAKVYRRRFATPKGFRVGATFGGWVLYKHVANRRRYFLYEPSSPTMPAIKAPCCYDLTLNGVTGNYNPQAILALKHWLFLLKKINVCSSHLVAAPAANALLIDAPLGSYYFSPKTTNVLLTRHFTYTDIAFHRGKIFALSTTEHLFSHWLAGDGETDTMEMEGLFSHWSSGETPYQIQTEHVIKEQPSSTMAAAANNYHHLVTSADNQKLQMVRWGIPQRSNGIEADNQTMSLQVFEAELDKGRWSEVKDLGNQVLFVGPTGSRAFFAQGSSEHYYSQKLQGGNRVFILRHDWESAQRLAAATHVGTLNAKSFLMTFLAIVCMIW